MSEIDAPHRLRLAGAGISPLGSARGNGLVELTPIGNGTRLSYDYEAQVSGKVAAVGATHARKARRKSCCSQLFESLGRQAAGKPLVAGRAVRGCRDFLARFRRNA